MYNVFIKKFKLQIDENVFNFKLILNIIYIFTEIYFYKLLKHLILIIKNKN